MTTFDGQTLTAEDPPRLSAQLEQVRTIMADGKWRTLAVIQSLMNGSPTTQSISARLRDFRKAKFGGYVVERQRVSPGLYEYRVDFNRKNEA